MKQKPKNQRKNGVLQGENKLTVIIAFAKRCNEPHYINKKDEAETQTPPKNGVLQEGTVVENKLKAENSKKRSHWQSSECLHTFEYTSI
jgi:hypothetical protein